MTKTPDTNISSEVEHGESHSTTYQDYDYSNPIWCVKQLSGMVSGQSSGVIRQKSRSHSDANDQRSVTMDRAVFTLDLGLL